MQTGEEIYLQAQIADFLNLIKRANERIQVHQEANTSELSLKQWRDKKEQHTQELSELLEQQYQLKIQVA